MCDWLSVMLVCSCADQDCLAISAVAGQGTVELIRRARALLEELPPPACPLHAHQFHDSECSLSLFTCC